jgi:hypothetical protein
MGGIMIHAASAGCRQMSTAQVTHRGCSWVLCVLIPVKKLPVVPAKAGPGSLRKMLLRATVHLTKDPDSRLRGNNRRSNFV